MPAGNALTRTFLRRLFYGYPLLFLIAFLSSCFGLFSYLVAKCFEIGGGWSLCLTLVSKPGFANIAISGVRFSLSVAAAATLAGFLVTTYEAGKSYWKRRLSPKDKS